MYKFPEIDKINHKNRFLIKKNLITHENAIWQKLPISTKSIYPVIGCFANKAGVSFPAQQTIADLTGLTVKTVRESIKGLLSMPDVHISSKISSKGLRHKVYKILPPVENQQCITFYKSMLESGYWRQMYLDGNCRPVHAVYITCLAYSFFNFEIYNELFDNIFIKSLFFTEQFKNRKHDFFMGDISVIASKAGVALNSAKKAIRILIDMDLLQEIPSLFHNENRTVYKIFNRPLFDKDKAGDFNYYSYDREYLNKCLKKTQPAETEFKQKMTGTYE